MLRPHSRTAARIAASAVPSTLCAEYWRALDLAATPKGHAWLKRHGWPRGALTQGIGGGLLRIEPHGATYDQGDATGIPAIICPCWNGQAPGLPEDIIDLVAWCPSLDRTFTRRGVAAVLGEEAIRRSEPMMASARPLVIYRNPLEWAQAHTWNDSGDHGIVIVDWEQVRLALGHLKGAVEMLVPTIEMGRKLRRALQEPPPPMPRILVSSEEAAA